MNKSRIIAIASAVVLLELTLCVGLTFRPFNLTKVPYRRAERAAAMSAYAKDGSPENEKLYREEDQLATRYVLQGQLTAAGILLAVFLVIDGAALFVWRQNEKSKAMA